jgi:hypothetical protein
LANKLAQAVYGPNTEAVAVSNALDRHQRFGISYVEPKGVDGSPPVLTVLGHGDSYEAAFKMAEGNPWATTVKGRWEDTQEEYEEFKKDPKAYAENQANKLKELEEKKNG